jgi:hypothetical protein
LQAHLPNNIVYILRSSRPANWIAAADPLQYANTRARTLQRRNLPDVPHVVNSGVCGTLPAFAQEYRTMAKRRGNPNWGKPEPIGPVVPTITSFEQVVKEYKLTPDQYVRSTRLREWARRNKNSKYIPEALLEAWGFEIESSL